MRMGQEQYRGMGMGLEWQVWGGGGGGGGGGDQVTLCMQREQ